MLTFIFVPWTVSSGKAFPIFNALPLLLRYVITKFLLLRTSRVRGSEKKATTFRLLLGIPISSQPNSGDIGTF